jgi:hypothetical protein
MSSDIDAAEEVAIDEQVILVRINQLYHDGMTSDELYDATRRAWRLSEGHCQDAKYALAVFQGDVKEVYEIEGWDREGTTPDKTKINPNPPNPHSGRLEFLGKLADNTIRDKYLFKSVRQYLPKGSRFPVHYVNC